jgi:hypothetical protein
MKRQETPGGPKGGRLGNERDPADAVRHPVDGVAAERREALIASRPGTDRSHQMNVYFAEIIAAERSAEFERELARTRLIREAHRRRVPRRAMRFVRVGALVAAGTFVVTVWSAFAP